MAANLSTPTNPKYYIAFLLIILHYAIIILPIITYFKTSSLSLKQLIIAYFLVIALMNIYYRGCPFIRIERNLLQIPSWIGVHEYLRVIGIKEPSRKLIETTTIIAFLLLLLSFWLNYN